MTPDGERLNQKIANGLSLNENMLLICGHYKGIDQRIREKYVTREISIGDYVLSGGELAAAVLVDTIGRLIPGVLNDETSALFDSFQDNLLAPPDTLYSARLTSGDQKSRTSCSAATRKRSKTGDTSNPSKGPATGGPISSPEPHRRPHQ